MLLSVVSSIIIVILVIIIPLPSACFLPLDLRAATYATRRLPAIQAQRILHSIYLLSAIGSWAEQIAHSACNSQVSCFSPCKLLRGREEAVSLQSHLHLPLFSCSLQGKSSHCVLHRQRLACRIPGCAFPVKPHHCRSHCPEGEVITPSPPHMALSCAVWLDKYPLGRSHGKLARLDSSNG